MTDEEFFTLITVLCVDVACERLLEQAINEVENEELERKIETGSLNGHYKIWY